MDSYPYLEPGDTVTFDLATGLRGITGEVVDVDVAADGRWRTLSIREDAHPDPVHFRADLITIWRKGDPIRQQVPQGIAIPTGPLPPGLLGPNGGRG